MPILPAEPDVHPENLFDDFTVDGSSWWVAHAKPRQEKSLARHLIAANVPFYLPTIGRRGRIRGRIVTSQIPLFTGYLFLYATGEQRVTALTSNRIARTLEVSDGDKLLADLRQVRTLIESGLPISPEGEIGPGVPVEVTSGPLSGLTGTVIRSAGGQRFVVRVDFIQQGASVTLDDFALRPLGPPAP